jgi:hypothetical protein
VLALSLPENVGGDARATIHWERCDSSGYSCRDIDGANAATYTMTGADIGVRVRAWYWVENPLGDDSAESAATAIVRAAPTPRPPTPRPPRPPRPTRQPPKSRVDLLKATIAAFVVAHKPSLAIRNGHATVDTGRATTCPSGPVALPCKLHITARPAGASAHWRGRPAVAAESTVQRGAGKGAKVRFVLGKRAYALLRAHRKLTLSVAATITRAHSAPVRTSFTITVKLRK